MGGHLDQLALGNVYEISHPLPLQSSLHDFQPSFQVGALHHGAIFRPARHWLGA